MRADHDPLDSLLERWRGAAPPMGASVAPEVWQRIAAARPRWWERMELAMARPSFAAAFVIACVLLGLFLAEARISRLQSERSAQLAESYLRLIDPLLGQTNETRDRSAPRL